MNPSNPFGFSCTAPDETSSDNSRDYAPSPFIQQGQEQQQEQPQEQQQNANTAFHTSPANPNNPLGFGLPSSNPPRSSFNLAHPPQGTLTSSQADPHNPLGTGLGAQGLPNTIISSHTDANPADIPDDDVDELTRIRNRFHNHQNRLMTLETLGERDAGPGGRIGSISYGASEEMNWDTQEKKDEKLIKWFLEKVERRGEYGAGCGREGGGCG